MAPKKQRKGKEPEAPTGGGGGGDDDDGDDVRSLVARAPREALEAFIANVSPHPRLSSPSFHLSAFLFPPHRIRRRPAPPTPRASPAAAADRAPEAPHVENRGTSARPRSFRRLPHRRYFQRPLGTSLGRYLSPFTYRESATAPLPGPTQAYARGGGDGGGGGLPGGADELHALLSGRAPRLPPDATVTRGGLWFADTPTLTAQQPPQTPEAGAGYGEQSLHRRSISSSLLCAYVGAFTLKVE